MTLELILILVFGTLFGTFLVTGMLSLRGADLLGLDIEEATDGGQAPAAVPPVAAQNRAELIRRLERRLRHEVKLAQHFVDRPCKETLWP